MQALAGYQDPAAHLRLMRMHGRKVLGREDLHLDPRWHEAVNWLAELDRGESLSLNLES
jgi:beta-N-acetylhexosaminidase